MDYCVLWPLASRGEIITNTGFIADTRGVTGGGCEKIGRKRDEEDGKESEQQRLKASYMNPSQTKHYIQPVRPWPGELAVVEAICLLCKKL